MRRTVGWAALAVVVAFSVGVMAGEKATEDLERMMKSMSTLTGPMGLRGHVPAKDYAAIAKDAATLKANFAKLEQFVAQKKWDDVMASTKAGAKAAADLEAAAKAKDDAAITAATSAVTKTCGTCHAAHRERLPDSTFGIK
jgi:cytochrome c556